VQAIILFDGIALASKQIERSNSAAKDTEALTDTAKTMPTIKKYRPVELTARIRNLINLSRSHILKFDVKIAQLKPAK